MWLDSLRKILGLQPRTRRPRRKLPPRKRSTIRPGVETLEDRFAPTASVMTNALDYVPGEIATFTASGFDKGATVQFKVVNAATPSTTVAAWSVKDGSTTDLDHLKNGT